MRLVEWIYLGLWMVKDLAWVQGWFFVGIGAGIVALGWTFICLVLALRFWGEAWHYVAQFLWLFGNFWWMYGELHDVQYTNEVSLYEKHTDECFYVLVAALGWLGFYYILAAFIQIPLFHSEQKRFQWDWRRYENFHVLLWLAKDAAWNIGNRVCWWVFAVPTVIVAFDMIVATREIFYVIQLLWVGANITWAFGELYCEDHDDAVGLFEFTREASLTMRWYSSWILVVSGVIVICYFMCYRSRTELQVVETV